MADGEDRRTEEESATWQMITEQRTGGLVGREGPSREMGSQLGLQSQVVVGPLIQEWGERVVPAGGNSMSAARVQAVAKGRNVLCALVSERQCGCPVCSTERSVPYRERGCSPVTAHSRPPRPTGAWVVWSLFPSRQACPQQDLPGL